MSDVHPAAPDGFGRGANAYVRGRPDFPRVAVDWLRDDLGLQTGKTVVDLGAGTGKFTRLQRLRYVTLPALRLAVFLRFRVVRTDRRTLPRSTATSARS